MLDVGQSSHRMYTATLVFAATSKVSRWSVPENSWMSSAVVSVNVPSQ